ncbi:hypothetical protein B0H17DRAFT_1145737 [Mycena rosella]|uniref:Uncharacterized protein n=1 Tax=Mycena rosella TaxID=1033263 RepID=A0AAD7CSN2_MYCRO|nr:hypothetical protein B0H17DRAFT_1145737 [Mycena rosella]
MEMEDHLIRPSASAAAEGKDDELTAGELFWRDHQVWLKNQSCMLRPRYRLGWVPSWLGTDKHWWDFEDGLGISSSWKCPQSKFVKILGAVLGILVAVLNNF